MREVRYGLALATMLVAGAICYADPPVVPTEPVKAAVGEDVQIEVTAEKGKGAYGLGFDTSDCLFFRGYSDDPAKMVFLVRPKTPGKYIVIFWTVGEGKSSRLVIDATGDSPVPVPPSDPLAKALQAAYTSDTATTGKPDKLKFLADLYRTAGKDGTLDDAKIKTYADVSTVMHAAASKGLSDTDLLPLRKRLQQEMTDNVGGDPTAVLDTALRAKIKAEFTRIAGVLQNIK